MKISDVNSAVREKKWQLQEAKNRLSQLVDHAQHEGPQTITLRGKPTAVVIWVEDFEKLTRPRKPLVEFFRQSPLYKVELVLQRRKEFPGEGVLSPGCSPA